MNVVTIATTNGRAVAFGHNRRDPEIVAHESHIDPQGKHEIWADKDLRVFYEETFGDAQREFDARTRESRRIGDYLDKITRDAVEGDRINEEIKARNKEHKAKGEKLERLKPVKAPVYEMIVGIYPQGDTRIDEADQREALRLYIYGDDKHPGWEKRNPGLKVVGAYYHADEEGEPHLHIDYVPVAEMGRGMRVQNSLERALNQSGYESRMVKDGTGKERLETAQQQWSSFENAHLQSICEEYGFDVIHPQRGKGSKHKDTADYKREQAEKRAKEDARKAADAIVAEAEGKATELTRQAALCHQRAATGYKGIRKIREKGIAALDDLRDGLDELTDAADNLDDASDAYDDARAKLNDDTPRKQFLSSFNLKYNGQVMTGEAAFQCWQAERDAELKAKEQAARERAEREKAAAEAKSSRYDPVFDRMAAELEAAGRQQGQEQDQYE